MTEVTTIPLKGFDQLPKQLLTLLISEVEDVPEGIHNRIHAAQRIEIPLPVSAFAPCHQFLVEEGVGVERGGGKPGAAETQFINSKYFPEACRCRGGTAERLASNRIGRGQSAQDRRVTERMSVAPQM
ncbi:hypothetical protein JKG68_29470 [Microvirga aerilata]|uniref:Uncharacterized protein n=1 Tax=Microvirga aerilata TaxID=670292 RepID=A0A937D0T0_9HYPH|nr:hypothetical protein [Microvirga aerilata]MBL0408029.1 hypothetical protein [Microvirga aerilata]